MTPRRATAAETTRWHLAPSADVAPLENNLQVIAVAGRNYFVVLHSADNDSWRDSDGRGKCSNVCTAVLQERQLRGVLTGNQDIRGELVGLLFHFIVVKLSTFVENQFLAVLQNVARFVKEAKPDLIVSFVFETQEDQGFVFREPARNAG
jgi:hypothetical protein